MIDKEDIETLQKAVQGIVENGLQDQINAFGEKSSEANAIKLNQVSVHLQLAITKLGEIIVTL